MPSEPGSPGPCPDCAEEVQFTASMAREAMARQREQHYAQRAEHFDQVGGLPQPAHLTTKEQQAIVDGEPYCYRCGKPASSFSEYRQGAREEHLASARDYVCDEEGTYNDVTNRFACDACYIAIGMPAGEPGDAYGWKAP